MVVPGARLMASGLPTPARNNGDVHDPAVIDLDEIAAWFARLGVPWGLRLPAGSAPARGRLLLTKALMALEPEWYAPPGAPTGAVVRRATPADLKAFASIDAAVFGDSVGMACAWAGPRLRSPAHALGLAVAGGVPVGVVTTVLADGWAGRTAYVTGVAVLPSQRRRGIGAALSGWAVERALEAGATLVHLHPEDTAAARLYARLGFVEAGALDVYVDAAPRGA